MIKQKNRFIAFTKSFLLTCKFLCNKLKIPPNSFIFYYSKRVGLLLPPRLFGSTCWPFIRELRVLFCKNKYHLRCSSNGFAKNEITNYEFSRILLPIRLCLVCFFAGWFKKSWYINLKSVFRETMWWAAH